MESTFKAEDLRIEAYTSVLIPGSSGAGKTFESVEILLNREKVFNKDHEKVIVFNQYEQDVLTDLKIRDPSIIFVKTKEELMNELEDSSSTLLLIDDYLTSTYSAENRRFITKLFLETCHHLNCTLLFQSQLLFAPNAKSWTVNCSHYLMFKSHHDSQVMNFFRNYGSHESKLLYEMDKLCTERQKYGHFFFSVHPKTTENLRYRNFIVPREGGILFMRKNDSIGYR